MLDFLCIPPPLSFSLDPAQDIMPVEVVVEGKGESLSSAQRPGNTLLLLYAHVPEYRSEIRKKGRGRRRGPPLPHSPPWVQWDLLLWMRRREREEKTSTARKETSFPLSRSVCLASWKLGRKKSKKMRFSDGRADIIGQLLKNIFSPFGRAGDGILRETSIFHTRL